MIQKISLFAFILLLAGCGQKTKQAEETTTPAPTTEVAAVDHHNAQNSLDYEGTYKGILPCADCEGIETEVILEAEGKFIKRTKYLAKEESPVLEETGNYVWNEAGNQITLQGISNAPNQYFVGENQLFQLDMEGKRITGELAAKYVLIKQ